MPRHFCHRDHGQRSAEVVLGSTMDSPKILVRPPGWLKYNGFSKNAGLATRLVQVSFGQSLKVQIHYSTRNFENCWQGEPSGNYFIYTGSLGM